MVRDCILLFLFGVLRGMNEWVGMMGMVSCDLSWLGLSDSVSVLYRKY